MGIIYLTQDELVSSSRSLLNCYREALTVVGNCEDEGHFLDVAAFDDGSTLPFYDRCRFAIEQAFIRGRWDVIAITSNLNDEANASALSIINDQMCEYLRESGDDANVVFNGRRFQMKYVLEPEPISTEDRAARQEEWFAQLGIEKAPSLPAFLATPSN